MSLLLGLLLCAAPAPTVVESGPLKLEVLVGETPQLFHVVDQLSGWNAFSHRDYRRYFSEAAHGGLSAEDEERLKEHAELRKKRGYGAVDQAFTSSLSLGDALAVAVKAGLLTPEESATERRVLEHFRARVAPFLVAHRGELERFGQEIVAAREPLTAYAQLASRFFGGESIAVKVVLVAATQDHGGGNFSRGQLVVEVGANSHPLAVLEHELWHAFAEPHEAELHAAAAELGTDFETVSEGLAYAISPGIFHAEGGGDSLARTVSSDQAAQKSFFDAPYVRFNRLGLALRPTLEPALRGTGNLATYLPIEKAVYRGIAEVALAMEHPVPRCFWFGPQDDELATAISQSAFDIWSRPMEPRFLDELRPRFRPHDDVFFGLVGAAEVPAPFVTLLAGHVDQLTRARTTAPSGELALDGLNGVRVLAFWAPDAAALSARVRTSALLPHP